MIMDHFNEKWQPQIAPVFPPLINPLLPSGFNFQIPVTLTQEEVNEFRKLVEEFKKDMVEMNKLLKRAKEYDKKMNQPDCEMDEKKQKLMELAKLMGVDIEFV